MSSWIRQRIAICSLLACLLFAPGLRGEDVSPEKIFAEVPFDQWVKQGPATEMPWKVLIQPNGLSLHQRMSVHIEVQMLRRELVKRPVDQRMLVLVQIISPGGASFRNFEAFQMNEMEPEVKKGEIDIYWDVFMLPGDYKVTLALAMGNSGGHNLAQRASHVAPPKHDPMPGIWEGLPAVEFLEAKLQGLDEMYRTDIPTRLHLPLASRHPVQLHVLADVTVSDLFHGSTSFYNNYFEVALPLLKSLSQVRVEQGSLDVALLDLDRREIKFQQDDLQELDWPRVRKVLEPENGTAKVDIKELSQRRESPAFLQDELLRRLNTAPDDPRAASDALHVFVIIGSPMDFYSFRDLPKLPPGSEEKCVVYYLQFELLDLSYSEGAGGKVRESLRSTYADGAIGNVRKMLKPLTVHVFKVRSAESVRHALAKMLEDVAEM
jgi:hypothetical protein